MNKLQQATLALACLMLIPNSFGAEFKEGPVITGFGSHTAVVQTTPISSDTQLKVIFDVSKQTGEGEVNRQFNSLARFINMHVANGLKLENIHLALVVHGKAGFDILSDDAYQQQFSMKNPNTPLLAQLMQANTQVYICGQSAAYYKIKNEDLAKGVNVSLSAMTANALLQQQGYTINPF
ncbi:DsrE family protein [Colwellia sp. MEBiC06753]